MSSGKLILKVLSAISLVKPMAQSTCDGSISFDEQAEPCAKHNRVSFFLTNVSVSVSGSVIDKQFAHVLVPLTLNITFSALSLLRKYCLIFLDLKLE